MTSGNNISIFFDGVKATGTVTDSFNATATTCGVWGGPPTDYDDFSCPA